MRPVQLELTNFGPYRKEVINFTQFDHAPLFLIGGDTGAGKSTLFDAMTVALFATTSGDRNVEEMRSTFAGPEDDLTKVTFYFQQGKHLYRIERVLQQERAKRGGAGIGSSFPGFRFAAHRLPAFLHCRAHFSVHRSIRKTLSGCAYIRR